MARTSHSESGSESGISAVLDGAGATGDSIGTIDTHCMGAAGTTPGAIHSTIEIITTAEEASVASPGTWSAEKTATAVDSPAAPARFPIVAAIRAGASTEATGLRLEDTVNPADRAEPAQGLSAVSAVAEKQEDFPRVGAPVLVAEGFTVVVVAGGAN